MTNVNRWLHAIHQVTGSMSMCHGEPSERDLQAWRESLERVAREIREEMRDAP